MKNLIKLFGLFFLFNLSNIIASEAVDLKEDAEGTLETITIVSNIETVKSSSSSGWISEPGQDKYQTLEIAIYYGDYVEEIFNEYGDEYNKIPLKRRYKKNDREYEDQIFPLKKILIIYWFRDVAKRIISRGKFFELSFFEKHSHLAKSKNLNFIATIKDGELYLTPDPTSDIRKLKEQLENDQRDSEQSEKGAGDFKAAAEKQQLQKITIVNHEVPELVVDVFYQGQQKFILCNKFSQKEFDYSFNLIGKKKTHFDGKPFEYLVIRFSDLQGKRFEVKWPKNNFDKYEITSDNLILYAVLQTDETNGETKFGLLTESDYLQYLNEQLNNILSQYPELLIEIYEINTRGAYGSKLMPEVEFLFYNYTSEKSYKWEFGRKTIVDFREFIQQEIKKGVDKRIVSQNDISVISADCVVQ